MKRLYFLAAFLLTAALAQLQFSGEPLVVPGDQLGWEEDELRLVLQVKQATDLELRLYSPGFDPGDYRAPDEMGDERYDHGQGKLHAFFELRDAKGKLIARKDYGVEPHRWDTLFSGKLAAGDYLLYAHFSGNGKNAVAFKLNAPPQVAKLVLQPGSMQTYNVNRKHGNDWQDPFTVNVPDYGAPIKVGIYDGDGPQELQVRRITPAGEVIPMPTPGNREWVYVTLREAGEHQFGFRQPPGAYQVTNTVGIEVFYGPIDIRINDVHNQPVPGAGYDVQGLYDRTVCPSIPEGWELVDRSYRWGKPAGESCVRFGVGGGAVRFVLQPQAGTLAISSRLNVCGGDLPNEYPLLVSVGDSQFEVSGKKTVELPPGSYPVSVGKLPGARISGPQTLTLQPDSSDEVVFRVEPEYRLELTADKTSLTAGETLRLQAVAASDFPGAPARKIELQLPPELKPELKKESEEFGKVSDSGWSLTWTTIVRAEKPGKYEISARLLPCGPTSRIAVEVTPAPLPPAGKPVPELERTIDKHVLLPGEQARVTLRVRNVGNADLTYDLRDAAPACLQPLSQPAFSGSLAPGETATYSYLARARFTQEQEGAFAAQLSSNGGDRQAPEKVRCVLLPLEKTVLQPELNPGEQTAFVIRAQNPTDHRIELEIKDAPQPGLGLEPASRVFPLDAGERAEWRIPVAPTQAGTFKNQAAPFVAGTPVGEPAWAQIKVAQPPVPSGRRASEIHLPFSFDAENSADCSALLIGHTPPAGSSYVRGSSTLDGRPVADPRRAKDGSLIWKLPAERKGELVYRVQHEGPLPRLAEPSLTAIYGSIERPVTGSLKLADYDAAAPLTEEQPELIVEPKPGQVFSTRDHITVAVDSADNKPPTLIVNGHEVSETHLGEFLEDKTTGKRRYIFHDVALRPGRNSIQALSGDERSGIEVFVAGRPAAIVVSPERAVADGRSPIELNVSVRDAAGLAIGDGYVVVQSPLEPVAPDAAPGLSGYRVALHDGVGRLRLEPTSTPQRVTIKLGYGDLVSSYSFEVGPSGKRLWMAHGSITAHYDFAGSFTLGGTARAYLETPLAGGQLQAAADAEAAMPVFDVSSLRSQSGLGDTEEPEGRFPHTGSAGEARLPLVSDDAVAFRYRNQPLTVGYQRLSPDLPGVRDLPQLTALHLESDGNVEVAAFAGLLARTSIDEEIVPDGTRVYWLSQPVKPGSEQITLLVGSVATRLQRLRDYVIDYPSGTVFLSRPLWPETDELLPVRLRVSYAPSSAPRDQLAGGAGVRLHLGPLSFGAGAATLDRGATWRFGAEADYRSDTFHAALGYSHGTGGDRFDLSADGRSGFLETRANLSYRSGQVIGKARLSAHLSPRDRVVLEHRARAAENRSEIAYERNLSSAFSIGLGAGYVWETAAPELIGRARYSGNRLALELSHAHPLGASAPETRLLGSYAFDDNLKARADLDYAWGQGLGGSLGLEQRVGLANLALSYLLPGESGKGNRARFGIRAPLPLADGWVLDLMAGYDYAFTTASGDAAAGVGVRYQGDGLKATLGVEGATGASGTKLTVRSGAAGQLGKAHTLGFDANYQLLPTARGRFTVSYAYRSRHLTVLTYHRLSNLTEDVLEGELAPTWHPSDGFQLRPSAAYRIKFSDPAANTYQLGLAGNVYFTRYLGLGAGAYYMWQPASTADHLAFNVEASLRALDGLWFNLGYTFGGFTGLTPEARPGIYLRLDLMGGEQ